MTIRQAQIAAKKMGAIIRRLPDTNEFRVTMRGGDEASACYTDDLDDALNTAEAMFLESAYLTIYSERS